MGEYKIDDVTEDQLKFSYWLLTHQQQLKKALIGFLIFTVGAIWGLVIYGFVVFLVQSPQDQQIIQGIINSNVDFAGFRERTKPQALEILEPQLIYTGNNKYDFVAEAVNPNERRGVAKLTYQFASGDYLTPTATIVILPKQKVYLMSLANVSPEPLAGATLKLGGLTWQSISESAKFADPIFELGKVKFSRSEELGKFSVAFTAKNNTLSNFWSVDLEAALFSGSRIVGVNQINAEQFFGEEARLMEISWFERLPQITSAEIVPVVNVYDSEIFFAVPGQPSEF